MQGWLERHGPDAFGNPLWQGNTQVLQKPDSGGGFEGGGWDGGRNGGVEDPILHRGSLPDLLGGQVQCGAALQNGEGLGGGGSVGLDQTQLVVVGFVRGGVQPPLERLSGSPEGFAVRPDEEGFEGGEPQNSVEKASGLLVVIDEVDRVPVAGPLGEWLPEQGDIGRELVPLLLVELPELPGLDGGPVESPRLPVFHHRFLFCEPHPELELVGLSGALLGRGDLEVVEEGAPAIDVAATPPLDELELEIGEPGDGSEELRPLEIALLGGEGQVVPELDLVSRRGGPEIQLFPSVPSDAESKGDEVVAVQVGFLAQSCEAFLDLPDEFGLRSGQRPAQGFGGLPGEDTGGDGCWSCGGLGLLAPVLGVRLGHGRGAFRKQGQHGARGMLASAAGGTRAGLPPGLGIRVEGERGLPQGVALDVRDILEARLGASEILDGTIRLKRFSAVAGVLRQFHQELLGGGLVELGEGLGIHSGIYHTPGPRGDKEGGDWGASFG